MYLAKNNDLTDSLVGHGAILFELFDLFFHQLDGTLQALLFFLLQVSPLRNATQQKNGSVWARRREPNIRFYAGNDKKKKKKKREHLLLRQRCPLQFFFELRVFIFQLGLSLLTVLDLPEGGTRGANEGKSDF